MTTTIWLAVAGVALVAIAALLALLLVRVQSLYRAASGADTRVRLDAIGAQNERLERELRTESAQQALLGRGELAAAISRFAQEVQILLGTIAQMQNERLSALTHSNEARLEAVRATVEQRLELLRTD